jgi:hypothetical protein
MQVAHFDTFISLPPWVNEINEVKPGPMPSYTASQMSYHQLACVIYFFGPSPPLPEFLGRANAQF